MFIYTDNDSTANIGIIIGAAIVVIATVITVTIILYFVRKKGKTNYTTNTEIQLLETQLDVRYAGRFVYM